MKYNTSATTQKSVNSKGVYTVFTFRNSIQPMEPYIPGRPIDDVKRAYGLSNVVKLASNENPYGCSPAVKEAVIATFGDSAIYPDGYCTKLRSAVSTFYNIPEDSLIFGAGTDEVISMLGKIFIEPGDEAITAEVTFSQYAASVEAMAGVMVYTPMQGHSFDLNGLLAAITPKTKLIFIANPNNPTGTYFPQEIQSAFMAKVPKNIVVIFDEAYQEYVSAPDYPDTWAALRQYPNAVLLKTFSKVYGISSFRVGFGVCHPSIIQQMEKIRCPFNVTSQAQAAAIGALSDQNFVQESCIKNRQVMDKTIAALKEMDICTIPSQTNFIMADIGRDDREVFEKLMAKGYIIRVGSAFGMKNFIRITIGTEEEMAGFIAALKEVLHDS